MLDSDVFDMWGDKGTYSKAFSIHFGYYKLMDVNIRILLYCHADADEGNKKGKKVHVIA